MSLEEIKTTVDNLAGAWETFKSVNDTRLKEIEKKATGADPLHMEQLKKINDFIDGAKGKLDTITQLEEKAAALETAMNRPALGGGEGKETGIEVEHKQAMQLYLKKGVEGSLEEIQKKALSVNSDPDGGYLVRPTISSEIIRKIFETTPMRRLASVETISSDSLEYLEDRDEASCGWTSETATPSDTDTPQVGKQSIVVHEMYAQPKATQKLLDDAAINIEQWLAEKVGEIFSRTENTAFISGIGVGKPRGILTYTAGTSWGQIEQGFSNGNGTFTADNLISLYYLLKDDYLNNATWLMNRATEAAARLLKENTTQQYIWQPGLVAGKPNTLLGAPVERGADMPIPGTGSLSIALADFRRAYKIVDRMGIRVQRDPYTAKPFVKFYTTKRVGGQVVDFEAIKLLKLAAS